MWKKIWIWLDNKKTIIAAFYWGTFAIIIKIWFPDGLPIVWENVYLTVGELLTFFGLGHKLVKKFITVK